MSHILRHNKTTYCCCGTKHDKDGNQLTGTESKFHCNWQENGTRPISFIKAAMEDGLIFPKAFLISKVAPIAMSPIGVATFPMLEITFLGLQALEFFNARPDKSSNNSDKDWVCHDSFDRFFHNSMIKPTLSRFKYR